MVVVQLVRAAQPRVPECADICGSMNGCPEPDVWHVEASVALTMMEKPSGGYNWKVGIPV